MERCGEWLPRGKPLVSHTSMSKLMGFWSFLEHSKFGGLTVLDHLNHAGADTALGMLAH